MSKFLPIVLFFVSFLSFSQEGYKLSISDQATNVQWYKSNDLTTGFSVIAGANDTIYLAEGDGIYYASFSLGDCQTLSNFFVLVSQKGSFEYPINLSGVSGNDSVVWYDGGALLKGENTSSLQVTQDGEYSASIYQQSGDCKIKHTPIFQFRNIANVPTAIDDLYEPFVFNMPFSLQGNVITDTNMLDSPTNDDTVTIVTDVTILENGKQGIANIDSNGNFTYNSEGTYIGLDSFTYVLCNISDLCDTAMVYINSKRDMPLAVNDAFSTDSASGEIQEDVTKNDYIPIDTIPYIVELIPNSNGISNAINGTVIMNEDGKFTYTANSLFVGLDSFIYRLCINDLCDTAVVYIRVACRIGDNIKAWLNVPDLLTPNNDGVNDLWKIQQLVDNQSCYNYSEVLIFSRWEVKIYHKINYGLDGKWWAGYSEHGMEFKKTELVPPGTYYYIIMVDGDKNNAITGFIHIQY